MAKLLTPRQQQMLMDYHCDGEASDIADFYTGGTLDWLNRERVINALHRKGMLDADGVTELGRQYLGVS